jgi:hypothetical protein
MNTDDKLLQILENSACLSKGQLIGYIKHTLYPEELRAVELHLSSCSLCNDALEGLEMKADVDKLIASMVPPVLPHIAPKEKPKEKKEVPVATKPEKAETIAAAASRTSSSHHTDTDRKGDHHTAAFRPKRSWARPMGVAAALLLAFGTFWFWNYNRDKSKNEIAQKLNQNDTIAQNDLTQQTVNAPAATALSDSALKLAEKKQADSIFLVRREAQRQQLKKDSLLALQSGGDSGKSAAMESPAMAAVKIAEVPIQADEEVAKKPAAAPAKAKEEPKKELTDFELGLKKYREKNYASALLYFKSAESDKDDPKHWEATYYSGLCNRNLNKDRKARKLFERIVDAGAPQKKAAQKQLDAMKKED